MEYVLKDAEIVEIIIESSYIEYYADVMAEHVTDNQLIFSTWLQQWGQFVL